jgi:hypothetical protein
VILSGHVAFDEANARSVLRRLRTPHIILEVDDDASSTCGDDHVNRCTAKTGCASGDKNSSPFQEHEPILSGANILSVTHRRTLVMPPRRMTSALVGMVLVLFLIQAADTQQRSAATATDWPSYRHDEAGTGHSPLRQINTSNVATLTRVWTYSLQGDVSVAPNTGRGGAPGGVNSQATPIVVNGVMYLPAANRVVALDPESGKTIWEHVIVGGAPSRRGLGVLAR